MARNEREPVETAELIAAAGVMAPEVIERQMTEHIRGRVAEIRTARGEVAHPTDTFALQRQVSGAVDYLRRYERAVRGVRTELLAIAEEEAIEGGNEVTDGSVKPAHRWDGAGIPGANVRIPDGDDTWVLTREWDRDVWIDWGQVYSVVAQVSVPATVERLLADGTPLTVDYDALEARVGEQNADALGELVGDAIAAGMARMAELLVEKLPDWHGPSGPKSSGVEAYAKALAAQGHDLESSLVAGAVKVERKYRGLKIERQ